MRPTAMHIHFLMYIKDYINRDLNSKSTISFIRNCGRAPQRCPAAIFICFCFLSIPETPVVLLPFRKTPGFSEVRTLQTVPDPPPARPDVLYFLSACYSPVPPCTCFPLTHPVSFPPGRPRRLLIPSAHNRISQSRFRCCVRFCRVTDCSRRCSRRTPERNSLTRRGAIFTASR